jgi:hypothetical protein
MSFLKVRALVLKGPFSYFVHYVPIDRPDLRRAVG